MTDDADRTETARGNRFLRALPFVAIVVAAASGYWVFRDQLSFNALREHQEALTAFRDAHYVPTVAAFVGAYVAIVALSLPGATIATLAGGFLFGLFSGVLFNVAAATLGASVLFLAARWGLGARLAARMDGAGGAIGRIKREIAENELSVLFLIRLVPAVPFVVANILPALVGVAFPRFALTTFVGIIPGTAVYTWVGSGLGSVFAEGGTPDLGIIFTPQILGPILALCALAALPIVIRAVRGKPAA